MDPASYQLTSDAIEHPPLGAEYMEWYETLAVIAVWDTVRSVATAWLTKHWIAKQNEKDKSTVKKRRRASKKA